MGCGISGERQVTQPTVVMKINPLTSKLLEPNNSNLIEIWNKHMSIEKFCNSEAHLYLINKNWFNKMNSQGDTSTSNYEAIQNKDSANGQCQDNESKLGSNGDIGTLAIKESDFVNQDLNKNEETKVQNESKLDSINNYQSVDRSTFDIMLNKLQESSKTVDR